MRRRQLSYNFMFRLRQRHQHVSGVYSSNRIILYYINGGHRKKNIPFKIFANEDSCHTTKKMTCTSIINILVDSTPVTVQRQQASTINIS